LVQVDLHDKTLVAANAAAKLLDRRNHWLLGRCRGAAAGQG
jgi:hypothetical protein